MHEYTWLVLYSLLIAVIALMGGYLPFLWRITHSNLQFYLTASAGVMLGAAFFHVMPEAIELTKKNFGSWFALGVVGLFCIERFIAPHSHEIDGRHHNHGNDPQAVLEDNNHSHHLHEHTGENHPEPRAVAPAVAGWMAVLGLTIHTFMNGVGLAGAVKADIGKAAALPGLAMFLAIFLHKPADALAISTVLTRKRVIHGRIALVQIGFALMVAVGALAFCLTEGALEKDLETHLIGAALAFSAGTFLFIALSDLLPEVQFHRHDRIPLFLTFLFFVILMWFIAFLEDLGKDKNGEKKPKQTTSQRIEEKLATTQWGQSPLTACRIRLLDLDSLFDSHNVFKYSITAQRSSSLRSSPKVCPPLSRPVSVVS
jgi:zinc and cadmium transporter